MYGQGGYRPQQPHGDFVSGGLSTTGDSAPEPITY